jgi:hypothetical protein
MKLNEILSVECIQKLEALLEEHCPKDGSGVNRRFLLEKSGLIPSLVDSGILPNEVLKWRELEDTKSNPELSKFKDGKALPKDFPLPPNENIPEGKDYIELCYEWYKAAERRLDAAAELIVMPVALGLTEKFISRRGANGGICRVLATDSDVQTTKTKSKGTSQEWSDIGLPENFIADLQNLLEKQIPPGAVNSVPAKLAAQFLGIDTSLAPRISQAVKLGKIPGFCNVQNKGIVREENAKHKKLKVSPSERKEETSQINKDFQNLSFSESDQTEEELG